MSDEAGIGWWGKPMLRLHVDAIPTYSGSLGLSRRILILTLNPKPSPSTPQPIPFVNPEPLNPKLRSPKPPTKPCRQASQTRPPVSSATARRRSKSCRSTKSETCLALRAEGFWGLRFRAWVRGLGRFGGLRAWCCY